MIKKVIKNRVEANEQAKNGITVYPCEEILGSMKPVKDFAAFFNIHQEELRIVSASYLLDYCETMSFTPEKLEAYRMGIDSMFKFFEASYNDTEAYIRDSQNKNNKSVG